MPTPGLDPSLDAHDPVAERHRDRARAESFGAGADEYDRLRPDYAPEFLDAVAALHPPLALDIGSGTGKVARGLLARGVPVLGLEPDARMADFAQARGVTVEVSTFEAWETGGRTFELVTCGNAWHWVSPAVGIPKLANVVPRGGVFAMCWTIDSIDESLVAALSPIYARCTPSMKMFGLPLPTVPRDAFVAFDELFDVEMRAYPQSRTLTADDWVGLMATVSDHRRLVPERLGELQREVREKLMRLGGSVHATCTTQVCWARRK